MLYSYAQVSTDGQSVDAQVRALRAAGAEEIFKEAASGAKIDRAQLRRALDQLNKGDVLMVTRLDRLARSFTASRKMVIVVMRAASKSSRARRYRSARSPPASFYRGRVA